MPPIPLHRCWNCEYDVADQLKRREFTCPECGSPIDHLRRRTIVYHGRRHIRAAKYSALAGGLLLVASLALTDPNGTQNSPAGKAVVFLGYAAIVYAIHRLDRMSWRFSLGGLIEWPFRVIGPLFTGACVTFCALAMLYVLRRLTGNITL